MTYKNIAICVRNPGKKYTLFGPQEKYLTIRYAIVCSVKVPFQRFDRALLNEGFRALKDVSFDGEQTDVV